MPNSRVAAQNAPPDKPLLLYAAGIAPLPAEAESVVRSIFANYGQVTLSQELGGGFTQSRVFVAQPLRASGRAVLPLVVKVGPTWLIEQEQAAYRQHIRDKLAGRVELVSTALARSWGVLGYRLAGDGQFHHESLVDFLQKADLQTIVEVVTGRLFKRLETLWREAQPTTGAYPTAKYDRLLPVHLIIQPQALSADVQTELPSDPTLLTPNRVESYQLTTGGWVTLEGFIITEVEAGEVTLDLPPIEGRSQRSHRLRLQGITESEAFRAGEVAPPLTGVVVQTRRQRLRQEIESAFPAEWQLDLEAETLSLHQGRRLPNPLTRLSELLTDWPTVNVATLHGDLNLQNILVDPASEDITLIDFANAGEDHVLHDLLHLETNVLIDLLPQAIAQVGESSVIISSLFYERLHQAATGDAGLFEPPRLLHPALKKPYVLLAAIRQEARQYLVDPDDWGEYYRGLALHLLGALKYKNLAASPVAPLPVQLAFLGAATAVALWQSPVESLAPTPASQKVEVWRERLTHALTGVTGYDLAAPTLSLSTGTGVANPLAELVQLLDSWLDGSPARLHGRLDPAALAAEIELLSAEAIAQLPTSDHLLHHLLRLETGLVIASLPQALELARLSADDLQFPVYERLHRAISSSPDQFARPKSLPAALAGPFDRLAAIRRRAKQVLTWSAAWPDYYRGLALHLLGALSQLDLTDELQAAQTKSTLLLLAALATDLWLKPTDRPQPPNPYRGLRAFQESDAPVFFGRETFVGQLVETLQRQSLVAVIGPSGSGKSSVVFAGVVPHLRQQRNWLILTLRPGSAPFEELARSLAPHLGQDATALAEALRHGRSSLPDLLIQLLNQQPNTNRLLLILDQFEELYTLCPEPDVRQRFVAMLLSVVQELGIRGQGPGAGDQKPGGGDREPETDNHYSPTTDAQSSQDSVTPSSLAQPDPPQSSILPNLHPSNPPTLQSSNLPPFHLLLTLRADFLGRALDNPSLAVALQPGLHLLGAMNQGELGRAIEFPAEKWGLSFEPGLVKRILTDVGHEPGRLPLLEFALTQLWQGQRGGRLSLAAYEAAGGVTQAVTHYAEQVYEQLDPAQQRQARRIFTQLIQPGSGTEDTRRVAYRSELEADWPLVQHLADARLVVTNRNAAGVETVEVVHEALIQSWSRLRDWMDSDRTFRAWQERLRAAIHQWQRDEQDEGGLLRGASLAEAESWLTQRETDLSAVERDFILRSISLREQQAAQRETDRQRQLRQAQERAEEQTQAADQLRRRAIWLGTALVMLLLAVVAAATFGVSAQRSGAAAQTEAARADTNLQTAEARATAVADNLGRAQSLATQESAARGEAVANLATAEYRATLEAEARDNAEAAATLEALARADADTNLATAVYRATLEAAARGQAIANLATAEHNATLEALARDQADANLATAQYNATQEALARGTAIAESTRSAQAEETAQAEATKAIEAEGTAQAEATRAIEAQQTAVSERDRADEEARVAVSRQLASQALNLVDTDYDLALLLSLEANRIKDTTETQSTLLASFQTYPKLFATLRGHASGVTRVSFSPNGQILASSSADKTIRLWDVSNLNNAQLLGSPLRGHNNLVEDVRFSPSGQMLASSSLDGRIILWDINNPYNPQSLSMLLNTDNEEAESLAFSPNGEILASSSGEKITLWDVSKPSDPKRLGEPFEGHGERVTFVIFSPDGRYLASASSGDVDIILWDVSDPLNPTLVSVPLPSHDHWVYSLAFSPNGQILASSSGDETVILWDISDPANPKRLGEALHNRSYHVSSISFSPNGQILASASSRFLTEAGSAYRTIILWDVSAPEYPRQVVKFKGHTEDISTVEFSPDGKSLVSASRDSSIILWDVTDLDGPPPLGKRVQSHSKSPFEPISVTFSPNEKMLASSRCNKQAGWNFCIQGEIMLWDVSDRSSPQIIGLLPLENIKYAERLVFHPIHNILVASGCAEFDEALLNCIRSKLIFWNVSNSLEPKLFDTSLQGYGHVMTFSPDGRILATFDMNGDIALWDTTDLNNPRLLGEPFQSDKYWLVSLKFHPQKPILASADFDGTVTLWDITNPERPLRLGVSKEGNKSSRGDLVFHPGGQILASIGNEIKLLDISDPSDLQMLGNPLEGHSNSVFSIAFSPNGRYFASGGMDENVILWDISNPVNPQTLGTPMRGHTSWISSIAFSPDGNTLASGDYDQNIVLWELDWQSWQDIACRMAGRNLDQTELSKYIPTQYQAKPKERVCPRFEYPYPEPTQTSAEMALTIDSSEDKTSLLQTPDSSLPITFTTQITDTSDPAAPSNVINRPAYIRPLSLSCGGQRLWTNGSIREVGSTMPLSFHLHLPRHSRSLQMWLAMQGFQTPPRIDGQIAHLVANGSNPSQVSLWSTEITQEMSNVGQALVTVPDSGRLVAVFLFESDQPPFELSNLATLGQRSQTFSYSVDVSNLAGSQVEMLLPLLGVTDQNSGSSLTKVLVEFAGQRHEIVVDAPNLGNGLFLAQLPFDLSGSVTSSSTGEVTITFETEGVVSTLGPRLCPPLTTASIHDWLAEPDKHRLLFLPLIAKD